MLASIVLTYRGWVAVMLLDELDGIDGCLRTKVHESVIDILYIGIVGDGEGALEDDPASVYLVVEEEGGDTCLGLAVDDSPVDGCGTTILREQGGMDIEGAVRGHSPNDLGQHTEGDDNLQVGTIAAKLVEELGVAHLLRLEHGDAMLEGILLDRGCLKHAAMSAHGLVGLGYYAYYIVTALNQSAESSYSKFGGAHEDYSHDN